MELTPASRRFEPFDPRLLVVAVMAGLFIVLVLTPLGSGDYGQWLMTARPFSGLSIPEYRAGGAVPPVVPFTLGLILSLAGDAMVAIRLFTILLLGAMAGSAYVAGATLFGSRWAGVLATTLSLLVVGLFLDLFAFGGLLQAASIVFAWLTVTAFYRAATAPRPAWRWWLVGAACVGLTALTHVGSAYILVPTGCVVAVLAAVHAERDRRARMRRLVPLAVVLVASMAFWLMVLLPGGTDLTSNPASLAYRGPNRLVDALTDFWPTTVVAVGGLAAIWVGAMREVSHRRFGPWAVLATWTVVTLGVLLVAVMTRAETDYPRFATPILAPLVIGAAGTLAAGLRTVAALLSARARRGTAAGWSLAILVVAILVGAPMAADRFMTDATGYQLRDSHGFAEAATWIEANTSPRATVLAPVREAKWLEGLTGRAALFSNAFRYSFRADEWQRSLAADTLLRSTGAMVNSYFFVRLTAYGADGAPRGLVIAANHGGEYVDLLTVAPDQTQVLSPDQAQPVLARLTNLTAADHAITGTPNELQVTTGWAGERRGASVSYRQTVSLQRDSTVLDLSAAVESGTPVAGLELAVRPASGMHARVDIAGPREATITFGRMGSSEPRLRVVLTDGAGSLRATADGGLWVVSTDPAVRVLVTDLTAAGPANGGLQWLEPAELIDRYGVQAVLLARDPALEGRRARVEGLGFHLARDFGSYLVFVR